MCGLGLALAGTAYRHPVTLVTDPGMQPVIARMLAAFGAEIDTVTQPHPTGGWQQARCDRVAEILATGTLLQAARHVGAGELIWVALGVVGLLAAAAIYRLHVTGPLRPTVAVHA